MPDDTALTLVCNHHVDAHFVKRVSVPLHQHILPTGVQDVWAGKAATKRFHKVIARLLADIRRERPAEATFAAHLLDIVDPRTGQGITDEFLQPEIALLFLAGFESARPLFSYPCSAGACLVVLPVLAACLLAGLLSFESVRPWSQCARLRLGLNPKP